MHEVRRIGNQQVVQGVRSHGTELHVIGDCTIIGKPQIHRLARVSRATVASPAVIGDECTLIDSVVMGAVELRYVTLVGVRVSGYGRINGHTAERVDSALIIRADLEVWNADEVRIGPHVDWTGVAVLGAGRISGNVSIEPAVRSADLSSLPAYWRAQDHNYKPIHCAHDLEHALRGRVQIDPFMGGSRNAITNKPAPVRTTRQPIRDDDPR